MVTNSFVLTGSRLKFHGSPRRMAKVADVCRHVRSKNAGPFWITVDFFFKSQELYARYRDSAVLRPALFERLYGANPKLVKRPPAPNPTTLHIPYPPPPPPP